MLLNLLIVAAMGLGIGLSNRFFSPQELQDNFEKGQKLYALADYDKAIRHYQEILSTRSNALIDVGTVDVNVDEFILPVWVAATYQLANSHNKLGLEKLRRSEFLRAEQNEAEAQERYTEALAELNTSLEYFRQILADPQIDERTRVMAQYQMLQTNYQLKKYEQVIAEGKKLLQDFPNSVYETATHYDIAWSHFELKQFTEAIGHFEQVLTLAPRGSRADRSLFQTAECYDQLGQYDQSLTYFDRLIHRYDFSQMTEQELIEMNTLKLKGVVQETARELVAKAELRRGDIYAQAGKTDQALEAYAVVPAKYPAETVLVQNSYIRAAELVHEQRGIGPAIIAYKNAIENVNDKLFQAQTQLTVARLLFEEGDYEKAAEEYRVFLKAYGDVAARLGFDRDKVLFREAECYQSLAKKVRATDPEKAKPYLGQAVTYYQQLLQEYSETPLIPDVLFGMGLAQQQGDQPTEAKASFQRIVDRFPSHAVAPMALLQIARLEYESGDFAGARSTYEIFLKKFPDSDLRNSAYMELGLTAKKMGDAPSAIAALAAVGPEWEQWPKIQVELAEMFVAQQDYPKAKAVLARAQGEVKDEQLESQLHFINAKIDFVQNDFQAAIRELDRTLALSPGPDILVSALFTRGSSYYEVARKQDAAGDSALARGNYEAGLADLKRLLEGHPSAQIRDSAFRTLGASMIRLQRQQEAALYYQELITASTDPQERAAFQMLLTELYYDMQDWERAQEQARRLLAMEYQDDNKTGVYRKERAYSIIGNALMQQLRYQDAAATFAIGVREYPRSGESGNMAFSKGFAEFNDRDYQAAAKSFRAYIDSYPSDRNVMYGHYYQAHSYQSLTEFKSAAEAFRTLADRFPNTNFEEEALFLWGENYYNERRFDQAIPAYQRLLERHPQGQYAPSSLYALGWCYLNQEKMDQGVEYMKELVKQFPQHEFAPKAQLTVGDYYYNKTAHDEALDNYQVLLKEYPQSAEAAKARALVTELLDLRASADYAEAMELLEAEKYREAIAALKEIVQKYPGTYTELAAYCNLGLTYERVSDWRPSAEYYGKVLEIGGDSVEAYDVVSFAKLHRDWIVSNKL